MVTLTVQRKPTQTLKQAQQALSDKFGIVTFTPTGHLSTVPKQGSLSSINVGLGGFPSKKSLAFAVQQRFDLASRKPIKAKMITPKKGASVFDQQKTKLPSQENTSKKKTLSDARSRQPTRTLEQAQQALSDKFGIVTFTKTGDVSTFPRDLNFSDINTGTGKFSSVDDLANRILEKAGKTALPPTQPTISGGGSDPLAGIVDFFRSLFGDTQKDTVTNETISAGQSPLSEPQIVVQLPENTDGGIFGGASGDTQATEEEKTGLGKFFDDLTKDPLMFGLVGIGVVMLVAGLTRKK